MSAATSVLSKTFPVKVQNTSERLRRGKAARAANL
jgi:hypothetical protein